MKGLTTPWLLESFNVFNIEYNAGKKAATWIAPGSAATVGPNRVRDSKGRLCRSLPQRPAQLQALALNDDRATRAARLARLLQESLPGESNSGGRYSRFALRSGARLVSCIIIVTRARIASRTEAKRAGAPKSRISPRSADSDWRRYARKSTCQCHWRQLARVFRVGGEQWRRRRAL